MNGKKKLINFHIPVFLTLFNPTNSTYTFHFTREKTLNVYPPISWKINFLETERFQLKALRKIIVYIEMSFSFSRPLNTED